MRDLSGRRQRDINNEKRLQDYVAKQVTVYLYQYRIYRGYNPN